mmetsp:Transcript_106518/g.204934  ORF Transcript_106518/g.204934 Transcript_106518/m.204934 type:complete len:294 (-) Transcript_106518:88-969(-)
MESVSSSLSNAPPVIELQLNESMESKVQQWLTVQQAENEPPSPSSSADRALIDSKASREPPNPAPSARDVAPSATDVAPSTTDVTLTFPEGAKQSTAPTGSSAHAAEDLDERIWEGGNLEDIMQRASVRESRVRDGLDPDVFCKPQMQEHLAAAISNQFREAAKSMERYLDGMTKIVERLPGQLERIDLTLQTLSLPGAAVRSIPMDYPLSLNNSSAALLVQPRPLEPKDEPKADQLRAEASNASHVANIIYPGDQDGCDMCTGRGYSCRTQILPCSRTQVVSRRPVGVEDAN